MIVLSIGSDRKIFEKGSGVRNRMIEYGSLFTQLHIIIFTLKEHNFQPEQISDNVWIYPTNSKNRFHYPFDAGKVFVSMQVKPHVVTTQDPFESGLAGWLIARKNPDMKLHMQIHTDFMSKYFYKSSRLNRIRVMLAKFLLPKAHAIRAVSDRIKDSLGNIDLKLPSRTKVLPIFTDIEAFKHVPITTDLQQKYSQFSTIILMASRLTSEKNIAYALEMLREIVLRDKDVGLIVVGEGPEKRYLEGLALRYHLDRNVVFESWQQNLASYYRTADIFLSTSLYEGYGLTLVEAAAAGCPIITSDVGIAKNIIEEGITGFVCDLQDKRNFTNKLRELIEDQSLRKNMRLRAEKIAYDQVGESKEVYLRKYKDMVEQA